MIRATGANGIGRAEAKGNYDKYSSSTAATPISRSLMPILRNAAAMPEV
jgi:hypothetical protein